MYHFKHVMYTQLLEQDQISPYTKYVGQERQAFIPYVKKSFKCNTTEFQTIQQLGIVS